VQYSGRGSDQLTAEQRDPAMDLSATHFKFGGERARLVRSAFFRYGVAVASVAIALGLASAAGRYGVHDFDLPVFELAVVLVAWFAELGPSIVAVALSAACYNYFFTEPLYSFAISPGDLLGFAIFVAWAVIAALFVNIRRRVEADLRTARDHLRSEIEQRKLREEEVRRLNRQLAARAAELDASNRELESFAYSVSHDLRAPLRHVAGYSELLQRHASPLLDDKGRRFIATISEASQRMGNLIDDLLAFSRISRADTRREAVDLGQVVRDAVREESQETGGRDIAWKIGALPVCYGDRAMLKLAVVNLVSNAVKFTRTRERAEIEIGSVDLGPDELEVFVKDNGAGFDMRYANKLFGVFQRLHRAEEFEGTGIGLATVQRIVHRHGGRVRAEGEVDKGATFYFSLSKVHSAAERTANPP
jgi:K+-sensing histidine kinase KdpD